MSINQSAERNYPTNTDQAITIRTHDRSPSECSLEHAKSWPFFFVCAVVILLFGKCDAHAFNSAYAQIDSRAGAPFWRSDSDSTFFIFRPTNRNIISWKSGINATDGNHHAEHTKQ